MYRLTYTLCRPFFLILILSAAVTAQDKNIFKTEILEIEQLTENTFIHVSFFNSEDWGKVACNGLVYVDEGEAIVFDTPVDDSASAQLISWIENQKQAKVKAVVINHFHFDCLGGLAEFHKKNIQSYSNSLTIELAMKDTINKPIIPQDGFTHELILTIGNEKIINKYFGEGHTKDNIACYIPSEKVLFGGCLIKSLGAGKGNLADANVREWSETITKVKKEFPGVKYVVPGHGKYGDIKLLDYTIEMFENEK